LAAKGQHREAMELFQRAISIDASQGWLLVEAADMLRVLGDSRQAVAYASRAIQLDAKDSWAWAVRGSAELELGAYSEALVSLNLALDVIPDYGWALLVKSQVQYKINEFESALDSVETATRSGFDDVDAWTSKAFFINILDGDPLVEADAARAALRVDSGNVNGMVKLGEALLRQGLMDEAVASFEAATRQVTSEETKRDYPDAALLGWSHLRLRHYDEALELLTASLAMDGFDTGDQFDLALALLCSGRDEVAMGEYEAGTVRLRAETHEGRRRSLVRVATHDMDAFIRDGQLTEGETVQAIRHLLVHAVAEVDPA
jgi:tetratricopeptide (TPR) repeat protein